jgi:plasmid stabilization system protein ParE
VTPRLSLRAEARADIREARRWYAERGAGLGAEFLRAVRATLAAIERSPGQFPVARGEVRRALVRRFPYGVYSIPETERTVVVAVLHGRRDPQVWQLRA